MPLNSPHLSGSEKSLGKQITQAREWIFETTIDSSDTVGFQSLESYIKDNFLSKQVFFATEDSHHSAYEAGTTCQVAFHTKPF